MDEYENNFISVRIIFARFRRRRSELAGLARPFGKWHGTQSESAHDLERDAKRPVEDQTTG